MTAPLGAAMPRSRRALGRAAGALVAGLLLVAACSDGGDDDAGPTPTTEAGGPTTVVDRSGIALTGVPGATTSTIAETGTARIVGSVQGPSGLVVGATVRIERLVAGREIRTDVLTGADGRFLVENVPGGRYRIRAFLAPTLAQTTPEVAFLRDEEEHSFDLVVEDQAGVAARADVAPEPPLLGRSVNLVAVLVMRTVDADGVVQAEPLPGVSVELAGFGRWQLRDDGAASEDEGDDEEDEDEDETTTTSLGFTTTTTRPAPSPFATTDSNGRVRFSLICNEPGDPGLYLRVPVRVAPSPPVTGPDGSTSSTTATTEPRVTDESVDLAVPACLDPATTTTLPPPTTGGTTPTTVE